MGCAAMDEKKEQKASNDNELLEKEQSGWLGSLKVRQEKMVARGKGRQHDTSHPKIETASAASAPSVMQELAVDVVYLGCSIASRSIPISQAADLAGATHVRGLHPAALNDQSSHVCGLTLAGAKYNWSLKGCRMKALDRGCSLAPKP